jgi:hypothetical protein
MLGEGSMAEHEGDAGTYRVTVYYREPTYELAHGKKEEPYSWTYLIAAASADLARAEAVRQFKEIARLSSVAWIRRVERIETERLEGAPPLPLLSHQHRRRG